MLGGGPGLVLASGLHSASITQGDNYMSTLKKLVEGERVRVHMVPGRLCLRPRGKRTVQLNDGSYARIDEEPVYLETNGYMRNGYYTEYLDPQNPKDREKLELLEKLLEERPDYRTRADYNIQIVGEFSNQEPWAGYDQQNAEQVEALWNAMPDVSRPRLEDVMKYQLSNPEDPNFDEKVKVLNKIHRLAEKAAAVGAEQTVEL